MHMLTFRLLFFFKGNVGAKVYQDFFFKSLCRGKINDGEWNTLCDQVYEIARPSQFTLIEKKGDSRSELYKAFKTKVCNISS